jgi:hypothetical protein
MEELYDSSGVDVTLIRESLAMTPAERLDMLESMVEFFEDVWKRNGIEPVLSNPEDAG